MPCCVTTATVSGLDAADAAPIFGRVVPPQRDYYWGKRSRSLEHLRWARSPSRHGSADAGHAAGHWRVLAGPRRRYAHDLPGLGLARKRQLPRRKRRRWVVYAESCGAAVWALLLLWAVMQWQRWNE